MKHDILKTVTVDKINSLRMLTREELWEVLDREGMKYLKRDSHETLVQKYLDVFRKAYVYRLVDGEQEIVRVYEKITHGDDYKKLADKYASSREGLRVGVTKIFDREMVGNSKRDVEKTDE